MVKMQRNDWSQRVLIWLAMPPLRYRVVGVV
jgi:hypothetical protein